MAVAVAVVAVVVDTIGQPAVLCRRRHPHRIRRDPPKMKAYRTLHETSVRCSSMLQNT